jgi:hypothetical protein
MSDKRGGAREPTKERKLWNSEPFDQETQHTGTPVVVLPEAKRSKSCFSSRHCWLGGTARVKGGRVIELVRESFRYSSDQSKERRPIERGERNQE